MCTPDKERTRGQHDINHMTDKTHHKHDTTPRWTRVLNLEQYTELFYLESAKRVRLAMNERFDAIFKNVPVEQKEELQCFRVAHPFRRITVDGRDWEYLCSPAQEQTILFLVGGLRYAEFVFQHMMALEDDYRVLTPSFGPASTVEGTLQAIMAILERERVEKVHVVGYSLSGLIAQCLVRKYPDRFETMILSNTTALAEDIDPELRKEKINAIKKRVRINCWFPYWVMRKAAERKLAKVLSIDADRAEFWRAYVREVFQCKTTKKDLINSARIMVDLGENYTFSRDDPTKWLGRILLIGSDYDPVFGPVEWNALKRLYPQAEEYTFYGTGHMAILLKQWEYCQVLTDFIRS